MCVSTYTSGEQVLADHGTYDIAFLDIEVDTINGLDLGRALKKNNPSIIIFVVTAYEKYLDDALDLNVFRFLPKPVQSDRLYQGLEKAREQIDHSLVKVFLQDGQTMVKVPVQDIASVEICGRNVKIVTRNSTFLSKSSMQYWEEKLVASFFYKIHKSFIVNLNYITNYEKTSVTMQNGDKIPISYRKRAQFQQTFIDFFN